MADLIIPYEFSYKMTQEPEIKALVRDYQDQPMSNIAIAIYSKNPEIGGVLLARGQTGRNGEFRTKLVLPASAESIYIEAGVLGMPCTKTLEITGEASLIHIFGGRIEGRQSRRIGNQRSSSTLVSLVNTALYAYIGSYDSQGKPNYLITSDVLDQVFLNDINASLPENQPVPIYNPSYLNTGNNTTLELTDKADVWVTFVHEGAGYRNTLGYYKYDLANPPSTDADIDTIFIVFPNLSFAGSGGALQAGDKVHLGEFPPNIGIGWVLIADGWSSASQSVGAGRNIFYSEKNLNPEIDPDYRQHNVILNDPNRDLLLIGFEDLFRDPGHGSDEDFNDAIFYTTINPITAVANLGSFQDVSNTADDSDGDGVPDYNDDYPNDINRAFNKYYPSQTTYGSLAFEDMWPTQGDYDCNDLVVDYRFMHVTNANNEVVEIEGELVLKAIGAAQHNGLGFQLDITPSGIASVNGYKIFRDYINLAANGCEVGQSKAVFFAFDDPHLQMSPPTGFTVNTETDKVFLTPDTTRLTIVLTSPINENTLALPPYNPFLVRNRNRDYEVHLPDYPPTDLADVSLFGTDDDNSDISSNRYYKTQGNLPWAMHFPSSFDYPVEKTPIIQVHNHFATWAQSNGLNYINWYESIQGYRNINSVYK
ncbi:MAG: LruC domain-containing protein [Aureispira sp.]|nr:LruC domain-containing protein [Aureispira sp.]